MTDTWTIHHDETLEIYPDIRTPDPHQDTFAKTTLGFWLYLMTDCLLFTSLFAAYAVLRHSTFGGPSSSEIFSLSTSFIETMLLLFSSFTCGFAILSSLKNAKNKVLIYLALSFLFGASFIAMELNEFAHLVHEGNTWTRSAFLTSFFSLVGTHGLHVSSGLIWLLVMMAQVFLMGITVDTFRRLVVFSLFWHFLDLVWIFIFTFVYLMGVI
jgi:cytochrome o ubiquinol oxidase subunit 3